MSGANHRDRTFFLTNYEGGGIGDFGRDLREHLAARRRELIVQVTRVDGEGSYRQAAAATTFRGELLVNLGLTAWGSSGPRNLIGFAGIKAHQALGYPTTAIVHHAIEIFDSRETGFEVTPLVRWGAHLALAQLRHCRLIVFSPTLQDLLLEGYGAEKVVLVPMPGEVCQTGATWKANGLPRVISGGYWAPYKGVEHFLSVASALRGRAEFYLAGQPHRLLMRDPAFASKASGWRDMATQEGVHLPGFLSKTQLDDLLATNSVGVLPYTYMSGASASFRLFADRGVPVVAFDFPEFRFLEKLGAGIALSSHTVEGLTATISRVVEDARLWTELAERQRSFSRQHSWSSFSDVLLPS